MAFGDKFFAAESLNKKKDQSWGNYIAKNAWRATPLGIGTTTAQLIGRDIKDTVKKTEGRDKYALLNWTGVGGMLANRVLNKADVNMNKQQEELDALADNPTEDIITEMDAPKRTIPQSARTALNISRQLAGTELPGKETMEQDVRNTTASAIQSLKESAGSPTDVMAMIPTLYGQENKEMRNIGMASATNKLENQKALVGEEKAFADQEDMQFNVNKWYPYTAAQNRKWDLENLALQYKLQNQMTPKDWINTGASLFGGAVKGFAMA